MSILNILVISNDLDICVDIIGAEFRPFVASGGYHERAYWTEAGWRLKEEKGWGEPRYWDDEGYNHPRHPVVGVSWYEAMAYCRWLSQVSGLDVRLPSEAEWEKAARGGLPSSAGRGGGGEGQARLYPWGNEAPTTSLCNYANTVGRPTPVGQYSPRGDSPYGCADMAGNVWEWCATKWQDSYEDCQDDHLQECDIVYVLRGGAYNNTAWYVRCALRGWSDPAYRFAYVGFRLSVTTS